MGNKPIKKKTSTRKWKYGKKIILFYCLCGKFIEGDAILVPV